MLKAVTLVSIGIGSLVVGLRMPFRSTPAETGTALALLLFGGTMIGAGGGLTLKHPFLGAFAGFMTLSGFFALFVVGSC